MPELSLIFSRKYCQHLLSIDVVYRLVEIGLIIIFGISDFGLQTQTHGS